MHHPTIALRERDVVVGNVKQSFVGGRHLSVPDNRNAAHLGRGPALRVPSM
jgi:hypothetical protein